jgi:hypothetical protein
LVRWAAGHQVHGRWQLPPSVHRAMFCLPIALIVIPWPDARASDVSPCQPIARLAGDSTVVAPIGRVLAARGIAAAGRSTCRQVTVSVNVRPAGSGYALVIQDPEGRTARRHLPNPEAAALVIESWTRADLTAPLQTEGTRDGTAESWDDDPGDPAPLDLGLEIAEVSARTREIAFRQPIDPRPPTDEAPNAIEAGSDSVSAPAITVAAVAGSAVALRLLGEGGLALDRSASWGARGGFCLRAGPVCVGLLGRYARAFLDQAVTAPDLDRRSELDLQLSAELPVRLGPLQIAPALGIGAGQASSTWRIVNPDGTPSARSRRYQHNGPGSQGNDHDHHPGNRLNTNTAMAMANSSNGATATEDEQRLLAEAGFTVSLPLGAGLALDLGLSVGSALARWGDSESPRTQLHGGLGLRYGQR